jgi:hypothetical protein
MAKPQRPIPQPFHPPVGTSDETYPQSRRWLALGVAVLMLLIAAVAIALRP